jgi:hypothetical protein
MSSLDIAHSQTNLLQENAKIMVSSLAVLAHSCPWSLQPPCRDKNVNKAKMMM